MNDDEWVYLRSRDGEEVRHVQRWMVPGLGAGWTEISAREAIDTMKGTV